MMYANIFLFLFLLLLLMVVVVVVVVVIPTIPSIFTSASNNKILTRVGFDPMTIYAQTQLGNS
jgi:hypothetical protein